MQNFLLRKKFLDCLLPDWAWRMEGEWRKVWVVYRMGQPQSCLNCGRRLRPVEQDLDLHNPSTCPVGVAAHPEFKPWKAETGSP